MKKDKGDIAKGLYLDVTSIEDYLVAANREFLANSDDKYIFVQATPIYPHNGLCFVYQRDISRMDRKVAKDTFTFYNHLMSAEQDRNLIFEIQRMEDLRELTAAELIRQQILTQSTAMRSEHVGEPPARSETGA